ncbi:xylanase [Opitutaceae bacterium EW11]|nr:xylanase [Opitutaceae bacterium EW11]
MKPLLCLLTCAWMSASAIALAAEPKAEALWPGKAPGETAPLPPEADMTTPSDRLVAGRHVTRLGNVSMPTLTIYSPEPAKNTGTAVLVFPGGGYSILALDLEGTEVCEWLNSIGVTGVLVKYRVPRRAGLAQHVPPLQDAQRALGVLRSRAGQLGIDPHRIGVLGFSAGAHLAAVLSNQHQKRIYPEIDAADQASCRPDFALLIYPGYLALSEKGFATPPEVQPNDAPPMFLVQTQDDPVHVENALLFYGVLCRAKVPAELHVYPKGGHGYGLRRTADEVTTWPDRAADWMRASGWLKPSR